VECVGSWLEIGQSISFFCITSLLLVWSAGICAAGEALMAGTTSLQSNRQKLSWVDIALLRDSLTRRSVQIGNICSVQFLAWQRNQPTDQLVQNAELLGYGITSTAPHFFFFGFFFFTPPEVGMPCVDGIALLEALAAAEAGCEGIGVWELGMGSGRRFCILRINERFKASNLLRNIDEYVLNLRHWCPAD
jgi:hypothetical protein